MMKNGKTRGGDESGTPKYKLIREMVRKKILNGTYPPGMRLPPDVEFHRDLRVNKLTVIRALSDLARDGLIVRRRGSGTYIASRRRPPLLPGRNLRLGILWKEKLERPELLSFAGQITRGALAVWGLEEAEAAWPMVTEHQATRATWTSLDRGLTVLGLGESRFSEVRHPPLAEVRAAGLDGLLAVSIIEQEWLDELLGLGLPTVLVDHLNERQALRADQVYVDPGPAYRETVLRWAGQGLTRIHFVVGFMSLPAPSAEMSRQEVSTLRRKRMRVDPDSYLRLGAYRQAMDECGLKAPESWAHFSDPAVENIRQLGERLLKLPEAERPEAVVCPSVRDAEEWIKVFAERGVALRAAGPTGLGYGGPALAIRAHGEEAGAAGAELLVSQLQRPGRVFHRVGVPMALEPEGASPAAARTWQALLERKPGEGGKP